MSTSASGRQTGAALEQVRRPRRGPTATRPVGTEKPALGAIVGDPVESSRGPWSGWPGPRRHSRAGPGSVTLHAILLLTLGLWYFAPPIRRAIAFDSRLAGSPHGVPEGFDLTGGMNTPLPMPVLARQSRSPRKRIP